MDFALSGAKAMHDAVSSSTQKKEKENSQDSAITKDDNGSIRIDPDALKSLLIREKIGNKPIAIISVVGQMRTGKSFLLNFFLRYLRKNGWENPNWIGDENEKTGRVGLRWRGGSNRCTTGIRIFPELFEMPTAGGGKMIVMLMDTQGLFDRETPEVVNNTLLTLSTLASSVQIFNCMKQITSRHLEYLKTCVDFSKEAAQGGGSRSVKLQRLMFLLRDFPEDYGDGYWDTDEDYDDASTCFGLNFGGKYIGGILDSEQGGEDSVAIRKGIRESFGEVHCFTMPSPGKMAEKRRFKGSNKELDEGFLHYIKIFVEEVASPGKLSPKCTSDKTMDARELLNMICSCDSIFAERVFGISNVMKIKANQKAYYVEKYEEAFAEYSRLMEVYIFEHDAIDSDKLEKKHQEIKKRAVERYNKAPKLGSKEDVAKQYLIHLDEQCEGYIKHHKQLIAAKLEVAKAKQATERQAAVSKYQTELQVCINPNLLPQEHMPTASQNFGDGESETTAGNAISCIRVPSRNAERS